MNLDVLSTFVRVAEAGSLTRASQVLDKPQPAISRKIASLERDCGGHLFLRTGRGVELTALGERVLARAQAILREAEGIRAEARGEPSGLHGEVTVGLITSLARSLAPGLFSRIRQRHPGILLRIHEAFSGELEEGLERGTVDVAVLLRGSATLQGGEVSFGAWQTHVIGPPGDPVTSRASVPFIELDGLPLVLPSPPSGARLQLQEIARSQGITLNVVAEANSGLVTLALIRAGAGYSVSPATPPLSFMAGEVAQGLVQAALLTDPIVGRTLVLRQGTGRGAAASEVARMVAETVQQLCGAGSAGQPEKP
jgi:LysR family nitrogen assimilation transcriptional regulator